MIGIDDDQPEIAPEVAKDDVGLPTTITVNLLTQVWQVPGLSGPINLLRLGGTYLVHKKPIFLSTPGLQGLILKLLLPVLWPLWPIGVSRVKQRQICICSSVGTLIQISF